MKNINRKSMIIFSMIMLFAFLIPLTVQAAKEKEEITLEESWKIREWRELGHSVDEIYGKVATRIS